MSDAFGIYNAGQYIGRRWAILVQTGRPEATEFWLPRSGSSRTLVLCNMPSLTESKEDDEEEEAELCLRTGSFVVELIQTRVSVKT